jgi:hypothetical protein
MSVSLAAALAPACMALLAGCTVIPPAEPGHGPGGGPQTSYPAQYPAQAPYQPQPYQAPAPVAAPAATPPYPPVAEYPPAAQSPAELPPARGEAPLAYAALGQTIGVGGPRITPLEVLEDSRCAMNARCVWAGQVRLRVRIESGRGGTIELTSGKPASVADGTLELVEVRPDKVAGGKHGGAIPASAYRFGFRFMGGY